jgi:hypothetical protein
VVGEGLAAGAGCVLAGNGACRAGVQAEKMPFRITADKNRKNNRIAIDLVMDTPLPQVELYSYYRDKIYENKNHLYSPSTRIGRWFPNNKRLR